MSWWYLVLCAPLALGAVALFLVEKWGREAVRNWEEAERHWKRAAENWARAETNWKRAEQNWQRVAEIRRNR